MITLFVVEMSSKKKCKRLCPFSSAKKAPKQKISKVFHKEWAKVLAASDKGSHFEQDKLLEHDGLDEEQDKAVPVFSVSYLKLKNTHGKLMRLLTVPLTVVLYSQIHAVVSKQF